MGRRAPPACAHMYLHHVYASIHHVHRITGECSCVFIAFKPLVAMTSMHADDGLA